MKQLNEKVAIVTGAGQGIGKGIALCLAKRGVKIVATGKNVIRQLRTNLSGNDG